MLFLVLLYLLLANTFGWGCPKPDSFVGRARGSSYMRWRPTGLNSNAELYFPTNKKDCGCGCGGSGKCGDNNNTELYTSYENTNTSNIIDSVNNSARLPIGVNIQQYKNKRESTNNFPY